MRIIFLLSVALITTVIPFSANCQEQKLSSKVLEQVNAVGVKQVIKEYYDKPIWNEILKGISSGKPEWLEVYTALKKGSDGASGEDLGEAVYSGIPVAPFQVLPFLSDENKGRRSIEDLCTFTFEASIPEGGINNYLTRIEKSLKLAKTKKELSIQRNCLQGLAKTRQEIKNHPIE